MPVYIILSWNLNCPLILTVVIKHSLAKIAFLFTATEILSKKKDLYAVDIRSKQSIKGNCNLEPKIQDGNTFTFNLEKSEKPSSVWKGQKEQSKYGYGYSNTLAIERDKCWLNNCPMPIFIHYLFWTIWSFFHGSKPNPRIKYLQRLGIKPWISTGCCRHEPCGPFTHDLGGYS